jgi:HrpA-like RNA helicase
MADINELIEKLEKSEKRTSKSVKLKIIAIHSDIPFEEQLQAFQPCGQGEAKVVMNVYFY